MKKKIYNFSLNIVSLFTVKAIELALSLGLIPYLIVKVGLENYGNYAFAMAMVLFFVNVLNYGFDLSAVRDLVKSKNDNLKISQLFNDVFSVKLFLLGIAFSVILLLVLFVPRFNEGRAVYLLASSLLIGDLFSLRWFFLGMEKMKFITIISFLSTLMYVVLVLIFIRQKKDFIWIPLIEAIGLFIVSGISFLWVLKHFKIKIDLLSPKQIICYLRSHFYSYINLLLPSTSGVLIIFLSGIFGLPSNVAFIQIGIKISSAFSTVNTVLTTVFYSAVNREKDKRIYSKITLIGIGLCFSITMYFASSWLIWHWLKFENKIDFENTITIMKCLCPIPLLMGIISSYGINGLLIYYKDKLYSWITIGTTLFMIILGYFLIPRLAIIGGVVTFVSARCLYALLSYYFFKMRIN